jgi:hypothetical protein
MILSQIWYVYIQIIFNMSEPLEINLDSTALASSGCILRLYRKVIGEIVEGQMTGGYVEKLKPASMVYGIAVHKFIDTMYKTGGIMPKAIQLARASFNQPKMDDPKLKHLSDEKHLVSTCMNVWEQIAEDGSFDVLSFDNVPATEITFSIPYYSDEHIRVNLCGTIDRIGKFKNGCYAIRDWKTTSAWDDEEYFIQYELSRQLRIYRLACQLMSQKHPDSVLGKIGATNMGVCIDGIFLKANSNEVKVKQSDVYMVKQNDLDSFALTLDDQCRKLSQAVKTGYVPKEGIINGSCGYGKMRCSMWDVCKSDENVAQALLKRLFVQKKFDPLTYNEV